jgi:hypothetical protein
MLEGLARPGRFTTGNDPLYSRLGGSQGRSEQVRKISLPPGFDPRIVQPVVSRYIEYAVTAHSTTLQAKLKVTV